ncbi:hypothetical protein D9615_008307 [Tricholomella constricta]|uniref:Uncharacterized protein n=1 Tax=Tricholomella constricta TaxID=117010 RepID=A0A8H5M5F2_9AGAR|nr:hypothetical protein D9615_008307 [Tricholomella constricta]
MLRRTLVRQQMGANANRFMGGAGPRGNNNNIILGVAALTALTSLAYWWGYRDVENRHKNDGSRKEVIGEIIPQL